MSGPSSVQFGRYEVTSRLGFGGMGEVFRAHLREQPEREVALKLIRPDREGDPAFRRMFLAEAKIGSLASHEKLVRLVDFGEVSGVMFLASELVKGLSLAHLMQHLDKQRQQLPEEAQVTILLDLLEALDYLHNLRDEAGRSLGVVHRDVSPSNLLISTDGVAKLADFGVVKISGLTAATMSSYAKGKPGYISPELLGLVPGASLEPSPRADIFSTGVLLHRMTFGCAPYRDIGEWVKHGAALDSARGAWRPIVARAMAVLPHQRFESAVDFATAVKGSFRYGQSARPALGRLVQKARVDVEPLAALDQVILAELAEVGDVTAQTQMVGKVARPESASEAPRPKQGWMTRSRIALLGMAVCMIAVSAGLIGYWLAQAPPTGDAEAEQGPLSLGATIAPSSRAPDPESERAPDPESERELPPPSDSPPPSAVVPPDSGPQEASPDPVVVHDESSAVRKTKVADRSSAVLGTGYLTLDSEPWAEVFWKGKRIGTTPFSRRAIAAGRQVLSLDLKGSGRRRIVRVTIRDKEETRLRVDFTSKR